MKYCDFIGKARKIHGDKYEYQYFDNTSVTEKIKILCPIHGEFWQRIYAHLKGQGCPKCNRKRSGYNTADFIKEAKSKFGDKFDYSKVEYKGKRNKVCIICKDLISETNPNGEFWQKPLVHLNSKDGMPFIGKYGKTYKEITNEETIKEKTKKFIEKAEKIYNGKYDYSKVEYKGCLNKVHIICPFHGEFSITPNNHLRGHSCPKCGKTIRISKEEFIEKAKKIHGNKYDYSKVKIGKTDEKVCIICPIHGEFWQTTSSHLRGRGCHKCARNKALTTEEFIARSKEVHGDKYDYSKVEYINNHTNVCIICPIHGEFWQLPSVHIKNGGCPKCNESHLEKEISKLLKDNGIFYEKEKKFENIKQKKELPFDFYLPKQNIVIECQGIQHFEENHFFKDENRLEKDKIKYYGCLENKIKILYYTNVKNYKKYFNEIYTKKNLFINKNQLLKEIKNARQFT